jgi:quinol monooxygenase YgiN
MFIVHVQVQIKPGCEEAFIAATLLNAQSSVQEPGIARFDVLRDATDPLHFTLLEVYRDADAVVSHKGTEHYGVWRDTVADMMATPRVSVKYENLFPADGGW